jgi:hypothetical protein
MPNVESRRKAQKKWRKSRHGRAKYNEYMRLFMRRKRLKQFGLKRVQVVEAEADDPFEMYDEALAASRASQQFKPKIIRPNRPL